MHIHNFAIMAESLGNFTPNDTRDDGACEPNAPWEVSGGVTAYIVGLAMIFYLMEVICDEFFVPALNILCVKMNLPDDVAGATFMAAGASSPELFVSLTGVLNNSPVGTGTVVGSELFNMLCICGASAFVAPTTLDLDWRTLSREVIFYALSIVLLLVVLQDKQVAMWEALLLVGTYTSYVFVCAYYGKIVKCFCPRRVKPDAGLLHNDEVFKRGTAKGSLNAPNIDTEGLLTASSSVPGNTAHERILRPSIQQHEEDEDKNSTVADDVFNMGHNSYEAHLTLWDARQATSLRGSQFKESIDAGPSMKRTLSTLSRKGSYRKYSKSASKRSKYKVNPGLGLPDEYEEESMRMHGFLYKKSNFYSKTNIGSRKWQRRWFMLKKNGTQLRYCRNPLFPESNLRVINLIRVEKVEAEGELDLMLHSTDQIYHLRAKDTAARDAWRDELSGQLSRIQLDKSRGRIDETSMVVEDETEEHGHLLHWPDGIIGKIIFISTLPITLAMSFSIPDARKAKWTKYYPLTLLMVVAWLAGMSYVMVNFSDKTGCILNIPADMMGLTIGSIGTSLPNLFASMLVAKQGLGNMAISNAFGSNVFNIFMALGIPWTVATVILEPGVPYPVHSSSIASTVVLLLAFLAVFIIMMLYFRFRLTKGVGGLFLVLYIMFLVYMSLASGGILPSLSGK